MGQPERPNVAKVAMSAFIRRGIAAAGDNPGVIQGATLELGSKSLSARDIDARKGSLTPRLFSQVRYAQTVDSYSRTEPRQFCASHRQPGFCKAGRYLAAGYTAYVEKTANGRTSKRYRLAPESMARSVRRHDPSELSDGAIARHRSLSRSRRAALTAAGLRPEQSVSLRVQASLGSTPSGAPHRGTHGIAAAAWRQRTSTTGRTAEH